jgi:TolB-like protein/DNA-binding winged helix-turn-helix (wHTH) protein
MASQISSLENVSEGSFIIAGWRVDPASLRISKDTQTVKLEPKAMAVLTLLASRPGVVFTRQELEDLVWAGTVVGYDSLSNAIIKLRKAFRDRARDPFVIETIAKTGYRIIAEVRPLTKTKNSRSEDADLNKPHRIPRKLAAILYADVAGYSRLTREDEDATHQTLIEYLDLIAAQVETHDGRVMHYAGDAVLAMFNAAIDAVNCASSIQKDFTGLNADTPARARLWFRIGVNSGDVFEDRGDVYGDGVNIAARLEGLAAAGGICVSESVRSAIGSSPGLEFQFIGEHQVKNIDEPVRVYNVGSAVPSSVVDLPIEVSRENLSIAVLPFDNMSGDAEQEYFSDGISEDITTDLCKISGLLVIARNSAFAYKGRSIKATDIGRELGVRYVLEGSVRKSGQRVRINAQMIDITTGGHVWAERYDRELIDVFSVQDEVTRAIVSALAPTLSHSEQRQLGYRETPVFEAYDYFLKGREQTLYDTEESNRQAHTLLSKVIKLDPGFSPAYSYLGRCHALDYINNWGEPDDRSLEKAIELGRKAVALDARNPHAHLTVGTSALWLKQNELALSEIDTALKIDPNFADGYGALGMIQIYSGEPDKAIVSLQMAMRLDPHYRDIYLHLMAQAYFQMRQYPDAVKALKSRLMRKPDSDISHVLLAACYGHLGEFDDARIEWEAAMRANPHYSIMEKREKLPYQNPADFDQIVDGLRKAGVAETE